MAEEMQKAIMQKAVKVTLYENVMQQFEQLLNDDVYKPGDKILPERELALQLGVSRNTLREVLKALELIGILETRQGGGYYLCESPNSNLVSASFRFLKVNSNQDIRDLMQTRRILETASAALAALYATEETVAILRHDVDQMRQNFHNAKVISKYDLDFHFQISKASGNMFLNSLTEVMNHPIHELMLKTAQFDDLIIKAVDYHEKILNAIVLRDSEGAQRYMNEHLLGVEEVIQQANA